MYRFGKLASRPAVFLGPCSRGCLVELLRVMMRTIVVLKYTLVVREPEIYYLYHFRLGPGQFVR